VRLEGLGQFKECNDLVRNRTRQLPACSIVPQPATLTRAPAKTGRNIQNRNVLFTASGLYLEGTMFESGRRNQQFLGFRGIPQYLQENSGMVSKIPLQFSIHYHQIK
jgi:hypothetical protein